MALRLNVAEIAKMQTREEILRKREKTLIKRCFENPGLNHEVLLQFVNRKVEWTEDLKDVQATVENIQKGWKERKNVDRQVKQFIQQCFENPELNHKVITLFLKRKIFWDTINTCILHGEVVKCKLCGENSVTGFWCMPCIHKDQCCFCCILLGVPFYR